MASGKRCASGACVAGALLLAALPLFAAHARQAAPPAVRVNELTLAGLRPGQSTLEQADKQLRGPGVRRLSGEGYVEWQDPCLRIGLRAELNDQDTIDALTAISYPTVPSMLAGRGGMAGSVPPDCPPETGNPLHPARLKTGRGLALGDPRARVLTLYGEPASRGPSTFAGRELELFFYEFDWAGVDVPQLMEVSCDRETGRVVKITLAFPTL